MTPRNVAVVGASLAGLRTVEALRRQGFDGGLTLIGEEAHPPYERPPLSKDVLTGAAEADTARLTTREALETDLGVDLRLGRAAVGLDLPSGLLRLDGPGASTGGGNQVGFDALVVATGARARQPFAAPPAGVLTLRTLDDALAVRAGLRRATSVVIVGAGFVGLEVASAARSLGLPVTVVEAAASPLSRSLGPEGAAAVMALARGGDVAVRCGRTVHGFTGSPRLTGVVLDDGSVLEADLAVVGVGAEPNTEWLEGSGLLVSSAGLHCAPNGQADDGGRVWGVGDVAAWRGPDGEYHRHEHWTTACEQARLVAHNLLDGGRRTLSAAPFVWSDQFGQRISIVGDTHRYDEVRTVAGDAGRSAVLYARAGRLTGACVIGQQRLAMLCRKWIAAATPVREVPEWGRATGADASTTGRAVRT
ncbi:NAD(P)/FAD-dependent oxidoreductase [Streptomyces sp. AJS327]|uniref:NAD(P)/FAD-dependent oxidoreductase n=1 Tax=Streptomyces sp. AJS327 TaxID=2545265 RepID=UPI0015E04876|nr:FAD/NAD(P)-binding oxidoreductase [Streptomyces sp. AJS327]MBA0052607.1 NAD(P)/FAD-dependent oxidoreductase [Streptomyces sp. AJS327]